MPEQQRRVKATDVAQEAGVSTATVSYVLNETPGQKISDATAQRVRDAATRLGYVSNPAAQMLARGTSRFVIVDMSDFITQESAAHAAVPVLSKVRNAGYEPFMVWWRDGPPGFDRYDMLTRFARATSPRAIISVSPLPTELQESLRAQGVQSLSSIATSLEDLAPAIALATQTQVEYLAEQGHTHILYVASTEPTLDHLADLRNTKGAETAAARGVTWSALPRYTEVPELAGSITAAMKEHPGATAIAAYNDNNALSALFALHTRQVEVPAQMAVMGIDNAPFAELTYPQLTSVSFDFDLSSLDRDTFASAIEGQGTTPLIDRYHETVRPYVHVRESA